MHQPGIFQSTWYTLLLTAMVFLSCGAILGSSFHVKDYTADAIYHLEQRQAFLIDRQLESKSVLCCSKICNSRSTVSVLIFGGGARYCGVT